MIELINVVHYQRRPMPGQVSIERLFSCIRRAMPRQFACMPHLCPRLSNGIWPRLVNILDAARQQSQVNHITGDVHYLVLALSKRQTLLTIHDCGSLERLSGIRRLVFKFFWFTLPIWRSQLVTVISESTRQELLRQVRCDAAKIRVVPNCVGDEFVAVPKVFNVKEPEILHLGTFPEKNLERLVPALIGLPCRLHVLGRLTPGQEALLQKSGLRYVNTPRATDTELVEAFKRCDLVAFVSIYEGFGLPIIEANATGRAVVTSNRLSMPEVAGNAACLVNPMDVDSIRQGILKVWHEPDYRDALIQAGFENVKRFTPPAVAAQYASIYRELAGH